jgi:hypothetical protein
VKPARIRRLLAGLLAGIFAASIFAGAAHVHRDSQGGGTRGATDNCALCSLSIQKAAPAAATPVPEPVRVAEPEVPLPSLASPVDPTPDRAPARAPPSA